MGLSIYYNGKFNQETSLSEMINEVKDIAEIHEWNYHIYENHFSENDLIHDSHSDQIYGISFSPPKCEPIWLCFLSNGKMSSPVNLKYSSDFTNEKENGYIYLSSTKTQYAGIEIHKLIIHLLKYISKKYFSEFNLIDEGKYWETSDEKILEENFNRMNSIMDSFGSALDTIPIKPDEDIEKYLLRILEIIHKKRNK